MKLTYKGIFNPELLMDDLLATFPQWIYIQNGDRRCKLTLDSASDNTEVVLEVPDDSDKAAIQVVISAHDASILSVSQRAEAARQAKQDSLRKRWDQWTDQDRNTLLSLLAEQMGLIPAE